MARAWARARHLWEPDNRTMLLGYRTLPLWAGGRMGRIPERAQQLTSDERQSRFWPFPKMKAQSVGEVVNGLLSS